MPNFTGLWTPTQQLQARSLNIWPAPPGAPTSVVATAGDSSASVAFTAPADTGLGGGAITGFTVTSSPGGLTATGASSPLTVVGLTNGTAYTFTVTATNAIGTGPASSASSAVTPEEPTYIEDVFSTYLYTGNGSTKTITNDIDLSGQGGLVWTKKRQDVSGSTDLNHILFDTARVSGSNDFWLSTNNTNQQLGGSNYINYNSNGFDWTFGGSSWNGNTDTFVSWTFRKKAKFFDIVTYTGTGAVQNIAHNLGSVPGCVITKKTSATSNWAVYHRGITSSETGAIVLNLTDAFVTSASVWNDTAPTSTQFTVGTADATNVSGQTYVAYLFAHDAGGFGSSGNDNVISCGSYTGNGSSTGPVITLGYEPQWILSKKVSPAGENWVMHDVMRGLPVGSSDRFLGANLSGAELDGMDLDGISLTPTGFKIVTSSGRHNTSGSTYIYIAIRRPMKPPTVGTSVFEPVTRTTNNDVFGTLEASDMGWFRDRTTTTNWFASDRVRGLTNGYYNPTLFLNTTAAESTPSSGDNVTAQYASYASNGKIAFGGAGFAADYPLGYSFKRAPTFFDIVAYTPTTAGYTDLIYHNLGVAPEMIIAKNRGATATQWYIHHTGLGASEEIYFNSNQKSAGSLWTRTSTYWNNSSALYPLNEAHVAYLFATCPGVSKVGSYTGNGTSQTIACGFTSGARFVLIKRTNTTGDWYVWDTARGIISGNDPYLRITTDAEVTNDDSIDPDSSGFIVNQVAATNINVTSSTYIFLAIA